MPLRQKFKEKHRLPYQLLLDTDLKISEAFGVYGEKKFMGYTYQGIHRTSYLQCKDGIVLRTYLRI